MVRVSVYRDLDAVEILSLSQSFYFKINFQISTTPLKRMLKTHSLMNLCSWTKWRFLFWTKQETNCWSKTRIQFLFIFTFQINGKAFLEHIMKNGLLSGFSEKKFDTVLSVYIRLKNTNCFNEMINFSIKHEELMSVDFFSKNLMKAKLNSKKHYCLLIAIVEEIHSKFVKTHTISKKLFGKIVDLLMVCVEEKLFGAADFWRLLNSSLKMKQQNSLTLMNSREN